MAPITGFKETKVLIAAIRDRPALYNPKSPQYIDKELKTEIWKEVFIILTPSWKEMSKPAKEKRGKDIQRRWKSIRDAYVKELRMLKEQGDTCYKTPGLKRKPYIYFNDLAFLRPLIDHRISLKQCELEAEENGIATFPFVSMMTEDSYPEDDSADCGDHHMSIKDDTDEITTYPDIVTTSVEETETDSDKMFLLSLVPSLHQMSEEEKSSVKIQIMQVIHQALYGPASGSASV